MQTYQERISRLSEMEKIRLLTEYNTVAPELGMEKLIYKRIGDTDPRFPTAPVLARCWDSALVEEVSTALAAAEARKGVKLLILPTAAGEIASDTVTLSEDPHLSASIAAAYLAGAEKAGVAAALSGFQAPEDTDARVQYEHLERPFAQAAGKSSCIGLVSENGGPHTAGAMHNKAGERLYIIRPHTDEAETVLAVNRGEICPDGSADALYRALINYRRLHADIEKQRATAEELEDALQAGAAISDAALDAALETLLGYVDACNRTAVKPQADAEPDALAARVLPAASVLLKNEDKFLPFKEKSKIALIGHTAMLSGDAMEALQAKLKASGHQLIGYEPGYLLEEDRNDDLREQAIQLAQKADVIFLFLGTDNTCDPNRLPANQLALWDAIGRLKKRVALVVSTEGAPDLGFTNLLPNTPRAILLAPLQVTGGTLNALDILLGKSNPTGRLTRTFVDHTLDISHREKLPIGPYLGYRFFDTVDDGALFPFGYGLTYSNKETAFSYSSLSVKGESISFTVTNNGKKPNTEVAQVYLGIEASSVLRPKKELIGHAALRLKGGEKKTVTLPLSPLPILDGEGKPLSERGSYCVSVGASVSDIRLEKKISYGADLLESDGLESYDYLPSVTNIFKHKYLLEAEEINMKSSLRNLLFGIGALLLAVCVKVYDIVTVSESLFLNIVAAVLVAGSIASFVLELVDRRKRLNENKKELESANQVLFEEADLINVPSADELFDHVNQPEEEEEEEIPVALTADGEYDYFADVDKSFTFPMAAEELLRFAGEKGISLDKKTALSMFAAFASSRLVIVKGLSDEQFSCLTSLLGAYFGCTAEIDRVDESYKSDCDLLFDNSGEAQNSIPRHAFSTLHAAAAKPGTLHIAPLSNVSLEALPSYFGVYTRFVRTPHSVHTVTVTDDLGRNTAYRLPENLWFLLNLKEGESLDHLPLHIGEIASVNSWKVDVTEPVEPTGAGYRRFAYGQILYLCDKLRSGVSYEENVWKKIDQLVKITGKIAPFHITNKQWLGLEMYMALLTDAKTELPEAADEAIAVKLLPSLIALLSGKLTRDDKGLGEILDDLFDSDNTVICRRTIKSSGAPIL